MQSILKYPGSKWRLMRRILPYVPPARVVLDAYAGSAAFALTVVQHRQPEHVVINDLDSHLINLLQAVRDQPEALIRAVTLTPWSRAEFARVTQPNGGVVATGDPIEDSRRYLIGSWMQYGTKLRRCGWRRKGLGSSATYDLWTDLPRRIAVICDLVRRCEIESTPAQKLIAAHNAPDVLVYADPPYLRTNAYGTREPMYQYEMDEDEHAELLDTLQAHRGPVLLSGMHTPLYDSALSRWSCIEFLVKVEQGVQRTECLWLNPQAQQETLL